MKKERELLEKLKKLIDVPVQVFPAIVKSVDEGNDTIDVIDADGSELFNVRLKANIDSEVDNVVMVPAVDSSVLVGLIGNTDQALYLVKASTLTQISGKIGDTTFIITTDGIVIDGGDKGPVFISQDFINDVNAIKSDLNALKTVFQAWGPANGDGGLALKTASATWFGQQLPDTEIGDVTNERLKH